MALAALPEKTIRTKKKQRSRESQRVRCLILRVRLFIFYEADVAAPADLAAVTHAIAHGGWMMVCVLMTSATAALPGSMSDSMGDSSRWIRRAMTKEQLIPRHSSSRRDGNVSRVREGVAGEGAAPPPRKQIRGLTAAFSALIFFISSR